MSHKKYKDIAVKNFILHYQHERPINWDFHFQQSAPLDLEIGFGLGEFLLSEAQKNPERNFVGIELDWQRIKKTLSKIRVIRQSPEQHYNADNIRVLQVEAKVALLRLFQPLSLHRVFCLFPCPWPKKGHVKYRLFSHSFCRLVNSRLIEAGTVQIVTDYEPHFLWLKEEVVDAGFSWEENIISPRFNTKFERKWLSEGQKEFFELTLHKVQHIDIPIQEDIPLTVYFIDQFDAEKFHFNNVSGCPSVILKDFLYDSGRKKAMVHLVVSEEHITQHLWIVIVHSKRGWCVAQAAGQTVLPTPGAALAIRMVADAVRQSADQPEKKHA